MLGHLVEFFYDILGPESDVRRGVVIVVFDYTEEDSVVNVGVTFDLAGVVVSWGLAKSDEDVGLEPLLDCEGFLESCGDWLEVWGFIFDGLSSVSSHNAWTGADRHEAVEAVGGARFRCIVNQQREHAFTHSAIPFGVESKSFIKLTTMWSCNIPNGSEVGLDHEQLLQLWSFNQV